MPCLPRAVVSPRLVSLVVPPHNICTPSPLTGAKSALSAHCRLIFTVWLTNQTLRWVRIWTHLGTTRLLMTITTSSGTEEPAIPRSWVSTGTEPRLTTGWKKIRTRTAGGSDSRIALKMENRKYFCKKSSKFVIIRLILKARFIYDSEQKVSSELSSSCSTPPPVPSCDPPIVEPFTEQEISVYKKLCQDLENLVQLTKGIDETQQPQPLVLEEEEEVKPPFKEQSIEDYIYDNCKKAHEEDKKPDVILESRRKESTTKESEKIMGVEEEESKDTLDDVFYRDFRLAKLSGDWKESTPNRRNSLKSGSASGADNWEGEIRQPCNQSSSSYNELSRLTAKCVCYITNHLTAQFFLLLVFLIVLLFAIVTVP